MSIRIFGPFFAPPDGPGDMAPVGGESDVDILNQVDKELPDDKDDKKGKKVDKGAEGADEDVDDEDGDEGEGEDDDKEVDLLGDGADKDDEDEEDVDGEAGEEEDDDDKEGEGEEKPLVEGKVDLKAIKTKYPKLFKEFPGLREAFFKGVNYERMFGSMDAAEVAVAKAENYDVIEGSLANEGDPSIIFRELQEHNPKALNKVLDNWLPKLLELDEDLYIRASKPALDRLIAAAHSTAKRRLAKNDKDKAATNLMYAAEHIANFVYGSPEIPEVGGKEKANPEREELDREKKELANTKFNDFDGGVHESIRTTLRTKISASLPKNLPKLVREAIVDKTMDGIDEQLGKDTAYLRGVKSLYQTAIRAGYTRGSQAKIVHAYLARANSVVNGIRNRLLKEAGHEVGPNNKDANEQPKGKRNISGKGANRNDGAQNRRALDAKQVDWRKTSDMDILNDKVTLRK